MRLRDARLLTDENVHPAVLAWLEETGFDALDVKRDGLRGRSDEDLLRRAHAEGRVIVTHDRDFGRFTFAARAPFYAVLYLRPGHIDPAFTIGTLKTVLAEVLEVEPPFTLVAERRADRVRLRVRPMDG